LKHWSRLIKTDPERGIRALLDAHGGLVYFTVRRVLKGYPEDDIEECVSDVFLYIYQNRDRLDLEDGAIKAYLAKTALHRALDQKRRVARIPMPVEDAIWDAGAADRSVEEEALSNLERGELIEAIVSLGDPDASILIAKYFIGMKGKEIAAMLHMKENTVAARAARALKRLRKTWKGEEYRD
jgi:RNA polymerase sigma-70 factor (ECF subfamily)